MSLNGGPSSSTTTLTFELRHRHVDAHPGTLIVLRVVTSTDMIYHAGVRPTHPASMIVTECCLFVTFPSS